MPESLCKKGVECGELVNLQWRLHWCILHIEISECAAHLHFYSPNLFLRRFLTILSLSMLKNASLQAILENHAFECIFYSCWLISNITPPNFRLYTKPPCLKKAWYIIDSLDVVKKRSKFLYNLSFENTEGGPLFCAPVKFQDYYQLRKYCAVF